MHFGVLGRASRYYLLHAFRDFALNTCMYSIQVSHGPKDRAESHNGLLLSARLGTLDASPGVLRHFCKVPRGEHGNDTVAHARSYCVVVQVDKFCEILPHSSGHLQPACSA